MSDRITYLADVMTTAIEGGINYWAGIDKIGTVEDPDDVLGWRYEYALVVDLEDGNEYSIHLNTIERGLDLIATKHPKSRVAEAHRDMDAGEIDALDADAVVQYGLFGEMVYA